jgi:hypothetical protein
MKSLSSAIVVACGTAMLITASAVQNAWSRDILWDFGCAVGALGLFGWALSMGTRIGREKQRLDNDKN